MAALRCGKVEIDGRDGDASATMLRLIDRLAERGVDERTRDRHADEEYILCIDDVIASDIFVGCYPVLPSIIHTPPNEPGELNFRDLGLGTVDILHLVSDINRDKIIVWAGRWWLRVDFRGSSLFALPSFFSFFFPISPSLSIEISAQTSNPIKPP